MADPEKDIHAIKSEVDSLKSELRSLTESLKREAEAQARAGYAKAREASDKVRHQARQGAAMVEDQIEERPLISVLTAFGVGFLIGKILDRK
ncbi:MAG TPA: DUF883 domain-containing protein [Gammaproteobacteria bacterium]|nr:DUF883 domain-containing protein [Gammaproteobacteria bacterium]